MGTPKVLWSSRSDHEEASQMNAKQKSQSRFNRFQDLIRALVAVPKKEVEIEEARWRADRLKKKKPAT